MKKKLLSVKELLQLPLDEHSLAAHYGTDYDHDAISFVHFWSAITDFENYTQTKEEFADAFATNRGGLRDWFISKLEPKITEAIKANDGTFLRKLADAIERHAHPLNRIRSIIASMAACQKVGNEVEGGWDRTAADWCSMIERMTGRGIDIALFRRWANQHGLEYKRDKVGRKPKHPKPVRKHRNPFCAKA